jgi:release factor glutamine methyltransferase
MTLDELYKQARLRIDPLDARLLMCHALHISQEDFLLQSDRVLSDQETTIILLLVDQRAGGRPIAKIKGYKEFYSHKFATSDDTLDPRPDTEILVDAAKRMIPMGQPCRVMDLGTGTGCIGLTLMLERPHASLVAVDISPQALLVARQNAERFTLMDRVQFVQSDWCSSVTGRFDVIVSNPPYIPSNIISTLMTDVKDHDPYLALDGGVDGLDPYRKIISQLPQVLAREGWIFFEVGHDQAAQVWALLEQAQFGNLRTYRDLAGIERVVAGCRL